MERTRAMYFIIVHVEANRMEFFAKRRKLDFYVMPHISDSSILNTNLTALILPWFYAFDQKQCIVSISQHCKL